MSLQECFLEAIIIDSISLRNFKKPVLTVAWRFLVLVLATGGVACLIGICHDARAAPVGAIVADKDELESYRNARPIVEWSSSELTRQMPELKGFDPSPSPEPLPLILRKVGENVNTFFRNFVNTASVEEIRQEWRRNNASGEDSSWGHNVGSGEASNSAKFQYLLLADPGHEGHGLREYRTDARGKPVSFAGEPSGFLLTSGFASLSVYFNLKHQPSSTFRYLGRKALDGRNAYLVAFAQRPEPGNVIGRFTAGNQSVPILVQGVAWIDSASHEIVRLRTELLAPQGEIYLEQLTTDISYGEVRFKESPNAMLLPREVRVTVNFRDKTYRNDHRYSNYRLFKIEIEEKPAVTPPGAMPE